MQPLRTGPSSLLTVLAPGIVSGAAPRLAALPHRSAVFAIALLLMALLMELRVRGARRREAAAGDGERRFRAIFEGVQDAVLISDDEGRWVEANPAAYALLGLTRERLLGRNIGDLSEPSLDFAAGWRAFLDAGQAEGEWRFLRADGELRDAEYTAKADFLPGRHLAVVRDVTERKRAEERLTLRERQLAEAQAVAHIGSWEWDIPTNVLTWSDEHYRIFGLAPQEDPINHPAALERLPPEDQERVRQAIEGALDSGRPFELDYQILLPEGLPRTIHAVGHVELDAAGAPLRMVGVAQDITDRKLAEDALRESEERYRILFDGPLPKILYDPETFEILAVNRSALEHYGYSEHELLRMTILDMRPPEKVDEVATLRPGRLPDSWRTGVWQHVKKDGTRIFVDVTESEVLVGGSKLRLASLQDVTEWRLAEERLRESHEALRALSARLREVREEESARIAREVHDEIGQMLTALHLDVAWMEKRLGRLPEAREEITKKLRSMGRMLDTTMDAVHRIATELRPGVLDELGLEAAIEWYVEEFEMRAGVSCRLHSSLESTALDADLSTALFRILQEALTNVARHARATEVDIRLTAEGSRVILEVTDDGAGIPSDKLADSRSLGLLGMRERARSLEGEVIVRRGRERGTTVQVAIPR